MLPGQQNSKPSAVREVDRCLSPTQARRMKASVDVPKATAPGTSPNSQNLLASRFQLPAAVLAILLRQIESVCLDPEAESLEEVSTCPHTLTTFLTCSTGFPSSFGVNTFEPPYLGNYNTPQPSAAVHWGRHVAFLHRVCQPLD